MRNRFDKLPKVDEKATKKEAEKELFEYREFLITLPTNLMPAVTPTYSLVPPSQTNAFHSSTEDIALERVEYEKIRDEFLQRINTAVNTLKDQERQIIIERYLKHEIGYDREIWMNIGLGKTKYYEIKGAAMLRLAFALKIEVYQKSEVKGA